MPRKTASEIFGAVDPHLTVINGGYRNHHRDKDRQNWDVSKGNECPRCHQEALRFRPWDGVCISCGQQLDEKEQRELKKKERFQKFRKKHNARVK